MHRGSRPASSVGFQAQWTRLPFTLKVVICVLATWVLVGLIFLICFWTPGLGPQGHPVDIEVPWKHADQRIVNVQVKPSFKLGSSEDMDYMRGKPRPADGKQPLPWYAVKRCHTGHVPQLQEMVGRFFFAHADTSSSSSGMPRKAPTANETVVAQVVDAIKKSWALFTRKDGFPEVDTFFPSRGRGRGRGGLFLTEALDTLLAAKLYPELKEATEWLSDNSNYDLVCGAGGLVQQSGGGGGGGNDDDKKGGRKESNDGDDDGGKSRGRGGGRNNNNNNKKPDENSSPAALVPLQLASSGMIASLLAIHFGTFNQEELRHKNDVTFLRRAMHLTKRIEQSTHSSTAIVRDLGLFLLEGMPVGSCCTGAAEECLAKGLSMSSVNGADRSKQQQQQRHVASVDASLGATLQELRMVSLAAGEFQHTAEERAVSAELATKLEEFTFGLLGATASCTVETEQEKQEDANENNNNNNKDAAAGGGAAGGAGAGGVDATAALAAKLRDSEQKKEFIGRIRKAVNCKQLLAASMDFILDGSCGLGAAALRSWASCKNLAGCTVPTPAAGGTDQDKEGKAGSFDARPTLIVLWNEIAKAIMGASRRFGEYLVPLGSLTNGVLDISECSMPGVFAQSFIETGNQCHLRFAQEVAESCFALYQKMPTGLAPALSNFASQTDPHAADIKAVDPSFALDQATGMFESLYYLFRATRDPRYRMMGSEIWDSIQNVAQANDDRFAGVEDVTIVPTALEGYKIIDEMPPRFIGGTLKFLLLLFSDESTLDLHSWILNCRGHAMPRESTL